jgi:hypothetical protein
MPDLSTPHSKSWNAIFENFLPLKGYVSRGSLCTAAVDENFPPVNWLKLSIIQFQRYVARSMCSVFYHNEDIKVWCHDFLQSLGKDI